MGGRIAAGLVGLGLVGGTGAVVYDEDGTAKVTIRDKAGQKHTVTIGGGNGQSYSCPDGTEAKLEPIDLRSGRIKITLKKVRGQIDVLEQRFPDGSAPARVVERYTGLVKRGNRLIDAFNDSVDDHNSVIDSDCEPAD